MCYSQNNNLNIKKNEMKTIDLNNFKTLPLDRKHKSLPDSVFYRTKRESIHLLIRQGRIRVETTDLFSLYTSVEEYSQKTKSLVKEEKMFKGIEIGIWKEYNENGELIKETDKDSNFQFSIESFRKKMNSETTGILNDGKLVLARRIFNQDIAQSFYEVVSRYSEETESCSFYLLDGNTGSYLLKGRFNLSEYKSPYEQYMEYLNNKKNYSQNDISELRKNELKTLALEISPYDATYTTDKETIILIDSKNYIHLTKIEKDSIYSIVEGYYKQSKSLLVEGKKFKDLKVGIWKEYNESGELIKETDYEKGFKFSSKSLIEKMKTEFDIDVFDETSISVGRYERHIYGIMLYPTGEGFLIDGNTGDLLFRGYCDAEKPLLAHYLKLFDIEEYEKFMNVRSKLMHVKCN
jgi:hypothetical protein